MKILQFSDRHGRDKDADTVEKMDAFLIDTARNEKPDMIINCGDTFDSQDVRMGSRTARQAIELHASLADIAPVVVIRGTESHDGNAPEILRYVRGKYDVYVVSYPRQVYLEDGFFFDRPAGDKTPECIVTLIPQVTKQFFKTYSGIEGADQEIGQAMTGLFAGFGAMAAEYPGVPHILVYHGGISGARLPSGHVRTGMDIEVSTDQMMMTGADLFLCGHIHQPQQIGTRCFYSGGLYPVKVDEQECGFFIHVLQNGIGVTEDRERVHVVSRYIPTPITRTARIKVDATGDKLSSDTPAIDTIAGANVRCEITAWQDEAGMIDRSEIEKRYLDAGALSVDIRIIRVPRANIRAESVLKAETLADKLTKRAELAGETIDPGVLGLV